MIRQVICICLDAQIYFFDVQQYTKRAISSHLNAPSLVLAVCVCVMAELPSGLLEACVVVGASSDKLRDIYQVQYIDIQYRYIIKGRSMQTYIPE